MSNLSPVKQALLAALTRGRPMPDAAPSSPGPGPLGAPVLSFNQERTLAFLAHDPGQPAYARHVYVALRMRGDLDVAALERAIGAVIQRHEVLRTTFRDLDGSPVPTVAERGEALGPLLVAEDVADEGALQTRLLEEVRRPFDFERGPMVRTFLLRVAPADRVLLVLLHHITVDGWSADTLISELEQHYAAFAAGRPAPVLPEPVQYGAFARWQRDRMARGEMDGQRRYWAARLASPPPITDFPLDRPRPARRSYAGAIRSHRMGAERSERVLAFCRAQDVSPYMALLAAHAALLHRMTGAEDLLIGTNASGRTQAWHDAVVGDLINTLCLRVDLSGSPSWLDLIRRARHVTLGALLHQEYPIRLLDQELRLGMDLARAAIPPGFNLENFPFHLPAFPGITAWPMIVPLGISQPNLLVTVVDAAGELAGNIEFNTDLYDGATIDAIWSAFVELVDQMVRDPLGRVPGP